MKLKGDTGCMLDGAYGLSVMRPASIEEALVSCEYRLMIRRCLDGEVGSPIIFCVEGRI